MGTPSFFCARIPLNLVVSPKNKILVRISSIVIGLIAGLYCLTVSVFAQQGVSISETGAVPHPSAALDVQSDSQGFLMPRLNTAQRNAISAPAVGLQVYNTDVHCIQVYMPVAGWKNVVCDDIVGGNCPPSVTDIDGNTYATVQIGSQCWMKENLRVTRNAAGGGITRFCLDNDPANCTTLGGLYQWATAMNGAVSSNAIPSNVRGICPDGWHLPSDAELCIFEAFLGIENPCATTGNRGAPVGEQLKAAPPVWNGTDLHGFTMLNTRFRNSIGGFPTPEAGIIWTSTENAANMDNAWFRSVADDNDDVRRFTNAKLVSYPVRCIKD